MDGTTGLTSPGDPAVEAPVEASAVAAAAPSFPTAPAVSATAPNVSAAAGGPASALPTKTASMAKRMNIMWIPFELGQPQPGAGGQRRPGPSGP